MAKFTEIFSDETKRGYKIPTSEYLPSGKFPIIDQGQGQIAGYTDLENGVFTDVPAIIFGDHTRIVKYVDTPFFLGADGVKVLKAKVPDVDYKYLFYCLQNAKIPNTGYNRHFKWLKEIEIPLVSLDDQHRIAAIFDKVIDLIAQRRAQLDKLDLLVKSRFVEMFGDPVLNPNGYKIQSLQSLIDEGIITYHLDGNHGGDYPRSEEFVDSGIPYIGANCIKGGNIDFSLAKYLTPERASKLRKGIAQNEDVLFAHNATVGPVVVLETNAPKIILSTSLTSYRCNQEAILPNYLKAYMLSDAFIRQYSEEMKQTTRNQVPITAQRKYLFMLPPISQQKEFDFFVAYTDKVKAQIQISLDAMEVLKKALMQQYFE